MTLKCIAKEKAKKEKAQSVRLRMSGKFKIAKENDNSKIEELTYEFFSRNFGVSDRGQAMEDIPKPPTADAPKVPPAPANDPDEVAIADDENGSDNSLSKKRKTKFKKKKLSKKKKKGKKNKLRKRKLTKTVLSTGKNSSSVSAQTNFQKWKAKKKNMNSVKSNKNKLDTSGKTLVQILKATERAERKGKKVKH